MQHVIQLLRGIRNSALYQSLHNAGEIQERRQLRYRRLTSTVHKTRPMKRCRRSAPNDGARTIQLHVYTVLSSQD